MRSTPNSPPAFPSSPTVGANGELHRPVDIGCEGITIRDYFAAAALQGYLASCDAHVDPTEVRSSIARDVYLLADAMIAAREVAA